MMLAMLCAVDAGCVEGCKELRSCGVCRAILTKSVLQLHKIIVLEKSNEEGNVGE